MTFPELRLILLILALLAACTVIALQFLQLRKLRRKFREGQARPDVGQTEPGQGEFRSSLLEATLKNRLENGANWRRAPEKYRYAAALAEQGADAERIAELLQLPLPEVQQLIALRKVKGGG
jgi:hypothetical protein